LEDARASLERTRGLDPPDWAKIRAAEIYERLGDTAVAGELAESAISSLSSRLARLTSEDFDTDDLYWVDRLLEGWRFIGSAAVASGDEVKAVKYLSAAWQVGFLPEAGLSLGSLRTRQGRRSEALHLLRLVASVPSVAGALSVEIRQQIDALERRAPESISLNGLMDLRTVRLTGSVLKDLTEDVLLLVGADGNVEKVKGISPRQPADLDRQIAKLGPTRLPLVRPDERSFKTVRRGLLACSAVTGCAFVLDVPGLDQSAVRVAAAGQVSAPTFDVTVVKPVADAVLRPGQDERVIVVLRYNLGRLPEAKVTLRVRDQAGRSLIEAPSTAGAIKGFGEVPCMGWFRTPKDATRVDVTLEVKIIGVERPLPVPAASYAVK
jgi:hypothetical protein